MSELPHASASSEPKPPAARRRAGFSRRPPGLGVALFAAAVVLFWAVLALVIGSGRVSLRVEEEAPFGTDTHPIATTSLAPRDLLPAPLAGDRQTLGAATNDEATATYAGERDETRITVRRHGDEAAARAAVQAMGRTVPEPKQARERVGARARDYYQYDGGSPGRSGFVYSSGVFTVAIDASRTPAREAYAKACVY